MDGLGVRVELVDVIGCVAATAGPVVLCGVLAGIDEFVSIAWGDLLAVGDWSGDASYDCRKQMIEVSRWFGHLVDVGTVDGDRLVGDVIGFECRDRVEVLLAPAGLRRYPDDAILDEVAIAFGRLDHVLDCGPTR